MADLEKSVRTRLAAHSGTSALVGTRIWYSRLPHDPTLPALSLQEITAVPDEVMGDSSGHVLGRVQVDAWGDTRNGAKALGEQVRDALQRWVGTANSSTLTFIGSNSGGVVFEEEGRIWRHRQDFEVWFTEAVA